jgi:hypothetical protein
MMLISHRGNLNGPDPSIENKPERIDELIAKEIPIEIDLRWKDNGFYLGHDEAQYPVSTSYLLERKDWLWIHCKDQESLNQLLKIRKFNTFWHQEDDYTFTTFGYTWAYPGKENVGTMCITVMPEWQWKPEETLKKSFFGICTDYVTEYQSIINNK